MSSSSKCLVLCCVNNCYSTQHTASLHKFPRDEERAKEWVKRCGRPDFYDLISLYGAVPGNCKLCSKHFTRDQFKNGNNSRILILNALPSVFDKNCTVEKMKLKSSICNEVAPSKRHRRSEQMNGVDLVSGGPESHFTRVINVQANCNGEASAVVEGVYGDTFVLDDNVLDDVTYCTVNLHDHSDSSEASATRTQKTDIRLGLSDVNISIFKSNDHPEDCEATTSDAQNIDVKRELIEEDTRCYVPERLVPSKLMAGLRSEAMSRSPSVRRRAVRSARSSAHQQQSSHRHKRKVGVVSLLEPWDLTQEFCREHGINYDSAIRCKEQMAGQDNTTLSQPNTSQHHSHADTAVADAAALELCSTGAAGGGGSSSSSKEQLRQSFRIRSKRSSALASAAAGRYRLLDGRREESSDESEHASSSSSSSFVPHTPHKTAYGNRRGRPRKAALNSHVVAPAAAPPSGGAAAAAGCRRSNIAAVRKCCYAGCRYSTGPLFPFPKEPGRCYAWAENCSDSQLLKKVKGFGSAHMNQHYSLCSKHFLQDTFLEAGVSLIWNAVPTVFSDQSNVAYPSSIYLSPSSLSLCADSNCSYSSATVSQHASQAFFSFPDEPMRCTLWVSNCSDPSLVAHYNKFGSSYIASNMLLCRLHFASRCFQDTRYNNSLKEDALPTIFSCSKPTDDTDNNSHNNNTSSSSGGSNTTAVKNDNCASDSDTTVLEEQHYAQERVKLANKNLFLREELEYLRQDSARQRAKLRYLKRNMTMPDRRQSSSYSVDDALRYCKHRLSPTAYNFFRVQMFSIMKPRWNEESLHIAMLANMSGKSVYKTLMSLFRFPCNATIRRYKASYGKPDGFNKRSLDTAYDIYNHSRSRRLISKSDVFKQSHKMAKPDVRKNKSVAQILEEFLGRQNMECSSEPTNESYIINNVVADSDELVSSDAMTCVVSAEGPSDNTGATIVTTDGLVHAGDIVSHAALVETGSVVSTDMVTRTLVDSSQLTTTNLVVNSHTLATKSLGQQISLVSASANHSYNIMKSMQLEDVSIAYMYDI